MDAKFHPAIAAILAGDVDWFLSVLREMPALATLRSKIKVGAHIDSIPPGFDFAGTGLHNAAIQGHRSMVQFLVARGASLDILDTKAGQNAASWAAFGKHPDIQHDLERIARERGQ
jgi:hypothetical protein